MIRISVCVLFLLGLSFSSIAQDKFLCRNGHASFYSKAMAENIEAHNRQTSAVLDTKSGAVAVSIPIAGFEFEKALMQEHFNENYMESGKYPKATFKGIIQDYGQLQLGDSNTDVTIAGDITVHGVTQPLTVKGTLKKASDQIMGAVTFELTVADFDIKVPKVVVDNIAKVIQVEVDLEFSAYSN